MAYEPTNWQTGDVITAKKLNHMENGIDASSTYVIEPSDLGDPVPDRDNTYYFSDFDTVQNVAARGGRIVFIDDTDVYIFMCYGVVEDEVYLYGLDSEDHQYTLTLDVPV